VARPFEVVLACHFAIALGTLFGGWRIVKTMGQKIIKLRPVDGFCAENGAGIAVALATSLAGIPVSTTHTVTGAIVGVGSVKRLSAVRWGVAGRVVWAWILTIPGAALVAVAGAGLAGHDPVRRIALRQAPVGVVAFISFHPPAGVLQRIPRREMKPPIGPWPRSPERGRWAVCP
jgi:Phosphate transporter family